VECIPKPSVSINPAHLLLVPNPLDCFRGLQTVFQNRISGAHWFSVFVIYLISDFM